MTPQGKNTLNFGLARDQVVHLQTAANLYGSSVKQIIFTQSWQLNDFASGASYNCQVTMNFNYKYGVFLILIDFSTKF